MRKALFLLLAIPVLGASQTKNVVSTNRVFPKIDKVLEFEKALTAHALKYHTGDWKWRVFEIQSGRDAGGYHIVEGPTSWTTLDTRGNLGTEHNNDWNRTVAINLTDKSSAGYSVFVDSLSTTGLNQYTDKIIINHIFPKPGMVNSLREMVIKMKKAWVAGNENVAVYSSIASGEPQLAIVSRLKDGLKELEGNYRKPMPDRYNETNGVGSWDQYLKDYAMIVENRWSEMLAYRADLSSK
jgi:hypothetical protein